MKGFIIFFVYIVLTLIILSSLGPTTKAGMGCYAAFSTVYVGILAIMIGCKEEDNEHVYRSRASSCQRSGTS